MKQALSSHVFGGRIFAHSAHQTLDISPKELTQSIPNDSPACQLRFCVFVHREDRSLRGSGIHPHRLTVLRRRGLDRIPQPCHAQSSLWRAWIGDLAGPHLDKLLPLSQ